MKKKSLAFLVLIPLLAGCNATPTGPISPIPYVDPEPETRSDVVYLGFSDHKEYIPSREGNFTVTIGDSTIVTYDNLSKTFASGTKAGSTLAVFSSEKLTVNVTVTVQDDGTAPLFSLDEYETELDIGDEYTINASLSFRGIDGFEESTGLNYRRVDEDGESTSISINEKQITITANSVGTDVYTIYTEYAGLVLSKNLTVNVIKNDAFVIIGKNISFDDSGRPTYNISMHNYDTNRINLRNDLTVSKGGKAVSYTDLTIRVPSEDIVSIQNDEIILHKTGTTALEVGYNGEYKTITITVYKPVIDRKTIELVDNKFALNLNFTSAGGTRVYHGDKTVTKTFALDEKEYALTKAASITVNDEEKVATPEAPISYQNKEVTLCAASFGIKCAGTKTVVLKMEADTFYVEYEFEMFFVTKELSTKGDLDQYLPMTSSTDAVYGYYTLTQDVDYMNYAPGQIYFGGADKSYLGFRGTLDGTRPDGGNYKLKNVRSSIYGFFLTIGSGALLTNIDFDNITLNNKNKTSALASFIFEASFRKLNFTLSSSSAVSTVGPDDDPCATGIISCQKTQDSYFEDITINAQEHRIQGLFGKTATNNTFTNFVINCIDITYYSTGTSWDDVTLQPTKGIRFTDKPIEGIIINKTSK